MTYAFPKGGLPEQTENPKCTAIFKPSHAVIPARSMADIVTSYLPGWEGARTWILARPMTGFSETFAQYAVELEPGGHSDNPEPDTQAQAGIFMAKGQATIMVEAKQYDLTPGSFIYIPNGMKWSIKNDSSQACGFHWIRKRFQATNDIKSAPLVFTKDTAVAPDFMPDTKDTWSTTRFLDPSNLAYDMHVNIVTFEPGARIPFAETHVMEHGLYVLQGTARYLLNEDWVDVGPGDFMWLRAFCPQACIATGSEQFRYLLYKDVNRHPSLVL